VPHEASVDCARLEQQCPEEAPVALLSAGRHWPLVADCVAVPRKVLADGARPEERRPEEALVVVARAGQRRRASREAAAREMGGAGGASVD
jgi:hypothetical protein